MLLWKHSSSKGKYCTTAENHGTWRKAVKGKCAFYFAGSFQAQTCRTLIPALHPLRLNWKKKKLKQKLRLLLNLNLRKHALDTDQHWHPRPQARRAAARAVRWNVPSKVRPILHRRNKSTINLSNSFLPQSFRDFRTGQKSEQVGCVWPERNRSSDECTTRTRGSRAAYLHSLSPRRF